ncbi:MAG: restriction endonuclease [Candidatus Sedimenticola sp. (ex Thyasira tokunagai)]
MGNKFIPLEKREILLQKIKNIRANYTPPKIAESKPFDWVGLLSWLFSGLGVAIASLGATSIVKKIKLDKETEVDIVQSGDIIIHNSSGRFTGKAFEYEKMVGDVLKDLNVLKPEGENERDLGVDFFAEHKHKKYIVEVKRYNRLLGLSTAREFLYQVNKTESNGILVVSSGVTQRTKQLIKEHNWVSDKQLVHLVVGESKDAVKEALQKIFT